MHLGQVGAGIKTACLGLRAVGHQPAAGQHRQQHAAQGDCQPHRREVEHAVGAEFGLRAKARHDQVGWGADQGGHAAENGAKGQWHENAPGWHTLAVGQLHGNRHEQRHGADVVHKGGQGGAEQGQKAQAQQHAAALRQGTLGQCLDRPRGLQALAEDQYGGDGDHGRVAKTDKGIGGRGEPGHHAGQQRRQGDNVMTPAAPEEEPDGAGEDEQNKLLAGVHDVPLRLALRACGAQTWKGALRAGWGRG